MVEEKFGEGSDEHFQALQELSDACLSAGKPGLAAPMLIILSRFRTYHLPHQLESFQSMPRYVRICQDASG